MSNVIECRDLFKIYTDGSFETPVLHGLNFDVKKGEQVAIVGSSGSGKSTLLHLLGTLDTPSKGQIKINGQDIHQLNTKEQASFRNQHLGFIYQFHHLLQEFTAEENVVLPQLANGVPKAEAHKRAQILLAKIGLHDRLSHRPAELSGGEQQRVAFCRALANAPKLLLADEPTGNLDPGTSDTVFDALMELVDTKISAVPTTVIVCEVVSAVPQASVAIN